jgi:sec-independent protein translocase protein TatB
VFGIGLAELAVIAFVAVVVLGPEKLPEYSRQLGRFLRRMRTYANAARDDLRRELGPEYADLELRDLDPRVIVRKHIIEAMDDDGAAPPPRAGLRPLLPGERPPYDADAT